ncbi:uncharacterized protein LOC100902136 [Galendromus occidentalis]|uniref:Uncharacterized protein LOC100902136 n=1 Tax=Galendromus occidentalis TaxID=34638 RepID=A0AAJ6QVF9_9ACAR|nr:uncharacterized protein LOC100902136 [Galendromus occidentalis]
MNRISEKRAQTSRPREQSFLSVDVTGANDVSDEALKVVEDELFALCRANNVPEPEFQIIGACNNLAQKDRHFISLLQIGEIKISSYPVLYTSKNGSKFDVVTRAIHELSLDAPKFKPDSQELYIEGSATSEMLEMPISASDGSTDGLAPMYAGECPFGYAPECPPEYAQECPPEYAQEGPPEYAQEYPSGYEAQYEPEQNGFAPAQEYALENSQGYPPEQTADYPPEQTAEYSPEQTAEYSSEQTAEYSSEPAPESNPEHTEDEASTDIYQVQAEELGLAYESQDIYAADFNAETVSEAELYGEAPAAPSSSETGYVSEDPTQIGAGIHPLNFATRGQLYAEEGGEYAAPDVEGQVDYGAPRGTLLTSAVGDAFNSSWLDRDQFCAQTSLIRSSDAVRGRGAPPDLQSYYDQTDGVLTPEGAALYETAEHSTDEADQGAHEAYYDPGAEILYGSEVQEDQAGAAIYENEEQGVQQTDPGVDVYYNTDPEAAQETLVNGGTFEAGVHGEVDRAGYEAAGNQYTENYYQEESSETSADPTLQEGSYAVQDDAYQPSLYEQGETLPQGVEQGAELYAETFPTASLTESYDEASHSPQLYGAEQRTLADAMADVTLQDVHSIAAYYDEQPHIGEICAVTSHYGGMPAELYPSDIKYGYQTAPESSEPDDTTSDQAAAGDLYFGEQYATATFQDPTAPSNVFYTDEAYPSSSTVGSDSYEFKKEPCSSEIDVETLTEQDALESHQGNHLESPRIGGSLQSRLQSAVIVNIKFDGYVTLNLHGPGYEAFKALDYNYNPEPVEACEIGQWYAVTYDCGDERNTSRAVAQYAFDDNQTYMMHFADIDYEDAVTIDSIHELENSMEVYQVPPQGLTVEVMDLTEKKISPHTVEMLLKEWLSKDVYIIPVETTGTVPKVRLIDSTGKLLDV